MTRLGTGAATTDRAAITDAASPVISVEGVSKTFGEVRALESVSLQVEPGAVYGLLGPNGAGKTTLIRILCTLLVPDSGRAVVSGIDVVADPVDVRTRIGLAGQFAAVDDFLTGRENVEMVARLYGLSTAEARRRAADVLERVHLIEAADRTVRTYSGGMRRRLDMAATLVGRPQVLFLDEPTTGIDPRSRIDLWRVIQDLVREGTTVLLTTQYLDEADALADRIAVIDQGRLISEGTADELKDRLGGTVLRVSVDADQRAAALEALRGLDAEPRLDERHESITIPAPDGPQTLMAAVRRLDAAAITPDDIALHKPTLDDVFVALTGHAATAETHETRQAHETPATRERPRRCGTGRRSPTHSAAAHVSFGHAVKDSFVITRRNLLRNVRIPQLLLFATVQPVMFLLLFNYVFGGSIGRELPAAAGGKYINYLIPGLLIQVATFGSGQTALGLTDDLSKGVIDRFRALPMARSAVLAGRTLSDLIRSSFVIVLMLAVGFLMGFRYQTSFVGLVAGVAATLAFAYALSWVMATVGLLVRNPEAAQSAVFLPVFPLVFASSVFVPTATFPSWLQGFADHQPVTVAANALRGLILGHGALPPGQSVAGNVLIALAWEAGILAVFAPLAVRFYRRSVS